MTSTEFGHAVRRWRDRVSPQAAGPPVGGHRRATGRRREELAQLAGIAVDEVQAVLAELELLGNISRRETPEAAETHWALNRGQ